MPTEELSQTWCRVFLIGILCCAFVLCCTKIGEYPKKQGDVLSFLKLILAFFIPVTPA